MRRSLSLPIVIVLLTCTAGLTQSLNARNRAAPQQAVQSSAGNEPTLGYLKLVYGAGCSDIYGVALDGLGRPYVTGTTTGCDNSTVFVAGPNYTQVFSFNGGLHPVGFGIAVDSVGNAYVTGESDDSVPAVNPIPSCPPNRDGYPGYLDSTFLLKLDPNGNIVYSTCIPNNPGVPRAVAIDSAGSAYVTGSGGFVVKIDSTPNVVYSRVLASTSGTTTANGIAVDSSGNAYITGTTGVGFPLVHPIDATGPGAFLAKLNASGTALIYSTYLTGSIGGNSGNGVAIDASGNAYVAGDGAFVTKVNAAGSSVVYSVGLNGTNGSSTAYGIGLDPHAGVYVTGSTSSSNFPIANAIQPNYAGGGDAFVAHLGQTGALIYSTYIGGSSSDAGTAIAVDNLGSAYPVGNTISYDFPTTDGSHCIAFDGFTPPPCEADTGFIGQVGPFTTAKFSPTSLTFQTQLVSTSSAAQHIALSNTGTAQMTVSSIVATGDYSQTNFCAKGVRPGTHCDIYVTFTPTASGTRTGTLTITDNSTTSPQVANLSGTGTFVGLVPSSLSFPGQGVGTKSPPKNVTLTNHGSTNISIMGITITGTNGADFLQTSNCLPGVARAASCTIKVTFAPKAKGTRKATLNVNDNGGGSPQTVSLVGTGT